MNTLKTFFAQWKEYCYYKKQKLLFYEYKQESDDEKENAAETGMDSIHWCWNCKYHECNIHY